MMTREEAEALVKKIQAEAPNIRFNGFKKFGDRYRVDLVDMESGRSFTVGSEEDWRDWQNAQ